uniref:Uncharacterized protein n=1 Tax=Lygus hesperus TaxID=30085 RepID=A0A146L2R4_LYGHE
MPSNMGLFRRIAPGKHGSVFASQQLQSILTNVRAKRSSRIDFIRKCNDAAPTIPSKNVSPTRKFYKAVAANASTTDTVATNTPTLPPSADTASDSTLHSIKHTPVSSSILNSSRWNQANGDIHDNLGCIV